MDTLVEQINTRVQVLSGCVNGFDMAVDLCTIIPALQLKMRAYLKCRMRV